MLYATHIYPNYKYLFGVCVCAAAVFVLCASLFIIIFPGELRATKKSAQVAKKLKKKKKNERKMAQFPLERTHATSIHGLCIQFGSH